MPLYKDDFTDPEWLYQRFTILGQDTAAIAAICGLEEHEVHKRINEYREQKRRIEERHPGRPQNDNSRKDGL